MALGKKTGGRTAGTPNKNKADLLEMITSTGCDHPIEGMARIAKEAHDSGDFPLAKDCYKELAQYVVPKKKAIEVSGDIELSGPELNINFAVAEPVGEVKVTVGE